MGDHRFSFKAEFEMHGVKDSINLGWCNWSGGRDGIDSRIIDWIEKVRDRAFDKFDAAEAAAEEEQRKPEIEAAERAELERLKKKYESPKC